MRTLLSLAFLLAASVAGAAPLRVCATVPDLGAIVRAVGADDVDVTVFAKGTEDPHFVEARPSFVRSLADADVLVVAGLDLEVGWLPPLLQGARNPAVLPGAPAYLDASTAIEPLDRPSGPVDRSMGDVHPYGNPHYLLDPLNGLRVAALVRDRLGTLRPDARANFGARYEAFRRKIGEALVGAPLAAKYDAEKLALLAERGALDGFLDEQGDAARLGGWMAQMKKARGAKAVDDHPHLDVPRATLRLRDRRAHGAEARHPADDEAARRTRRDHAPRRRPRDPGVRVLRPAPRPLPRGADGRAGRQPGEPGRRAARHRRLRRDDRL